jgi:hypothetical protein
MPPTQQSESPKNSLYSFPTSPSHAGSKAKKETVIIFDWDDTLLSSSFLSSHGLRPDSDLSLFSTEILGQLTELESSVISILNTALTLGEVVIVTNAETGWVQLSAGKFLPGVLGVLERLRVVSARSTFEGKYPDAPLKWKFSAMYERLSATFGISSPGATYDRHVLSFGDSHVEREAVRSVTKHFPHTKTKSVKFAERPSIEQLRRQLELVASCFQYIHTHDGDLDLQLTVTVNPLPANNNTTTAPASDLPSKLVEQRSRASDLITAGSDGLVAMSD